jgi:hypothetical protein
MQMRNKLYNYREEKYMSKHDADKVKHDSSEAYNIYVSIGKITKNTQLTTKYTGWSETEKERMSKFGYDGVDMIREWYS